MKDAFMHPFFFMQNFNVFDINRNKEERSAPTWEEYSQLLSTIETMNSTIATLQANLEALSTQLTNSVSALATSIDNIPITLPIKIVSVTLTPLTTADGSVMEFSTVMNNLIGTPTGDVLAVIRSSPSRRKSQVYKESQSNYASSFAILDCNSFNSHSAWWFDGSTGSSQFDVNWTDRIMDNSYATTYAFFSRH